MCQVVATGLQRPKNVLISAFITFQEVFWFFLFQVGRGRMKIELFWFLVG
jgi:hypothetical protein